MYGLKQFIVYFFPVIISIFSNGILYSQSVNKPFYNFKTYTANEGLVSNAVICVFKDSKGFLWIGTNRGVQRYNGSSFLTFRHYNADSSTIANETTTSIAEDKQQNIWIATRGGITKFSYSNGRLTNYKYGYKDGQPVSLDIVCCFFEDSQGRQWIGSVSAGLFLFDKAKGQFMHYPPAAYLGMKAGIFEFVSKIQETEKGEIIFPVKDGFVMIDKSGQQQYMKVPVPADKKIVYQPCGIMPLLKNYPDEVWISSLFNGIFCYNQVTKKWKYFFNEQEGTPMGRAINWTNDEWMCCYKFGAYLFNHRTGIFKKVFDSDKFEPVSEVYRDDAGNVWLSSTENGLHRLNMSAQLFSSTTSIKGWTLGRTLYYDSVLRIIYSMSPYNTDGIIAFNSSTHAINRYSLPGASRYHKMINNFIADNNTLYMARWGGMCRYNLTTRAFDSIVYKTVSFNSEHDNFFDVCRSEQKIYFAGGGAESPYMYDKQTQQVQGLSLLPAQHTAKKYFSNCVCFSGNILYTGISYGDSIYCYNEATGKKYAIAVPAAYTNGSAGMIMTLCVDKKQQLWCGNSTNGIYVYDINAKKWIKHINRQNGDLFGSPSQLICDEDGNVWCNSSEGLYVFNPNDFLFKHFTSNDGLRAETNGGYLTRLPNHQLAFNNITGQDVSFGIIHTKPADSIVTSIPISITNLKVMGKLFLPDTLLDNVQQVILPPNENSFSLTYAGVSITEGNNLAYSYLLEGAEKYWHNVDNEQVLSYIKLSPGNYTLHIKCKSLDGKMIGKERLLYIIQLPAWYQTWWFKLLAVLCLSCLIFLAVKFYLIQQLKKQQTVLEKERALTEERNRIAADMHDDVGAGLSRIRYITASLQSNQAISDADISKIVALSDELVEKMNEIIWALNQGKQQLDELIYYTRSQCSEMVNNAGMQFTFNLPENIPSITLNWKDCRNIYLLVKEAVNNAIKHAGAATITIQCSITDQLQFSIADNGKGFNPDTVKTNGNGLLNYKKRVEKSGGTYQLLSSTAEGTTVLFHIPFNPAG